MKLDADAVVMLDADGTYAPVEMTRLLEGLDHHEVVIGDRLNGRIEPDAMTRLNCVGNHLLTWFATALFGTTTADVCSGYWAFSSDAISRLQLNSQSFEIEAEMFASMVHQDVAGFVPSLAPLVKQVGSTAWLAHLEKTVTRRFSPNPCCRPCQALKTKRSIPTAWNASEWPCWVQVAWWRNASNNDWPITHGSP